MTSETKLFQHIQLNILKIVVLILYNSIKKQTIHSLQIQYFLPKTANNYKSLSYRQSATKKLDLHYRKSSF